MEGVLVEGAGLGGLAEADLVGDDDAVPGLLEGRGGGGPGDGAKVFAVEQEGDFGLGVGLFAGVPDVLWLGGCGRGDDGGKVDEGHL